MKEYSFSLAPFFQAGIRKDHREATNQPSLLSCKGLKALAPHGLVAPEPITAPMGLTVDWPFPQLFRNQSVTLAGTRSAIYSIDETTWDATVLSLYDAMNPGVPKTIVAPGDDWHWAGMGPNWIATNGVSTVFLTSIKSMYGLQDKVLVFDIIPFQTCCDHMGRVLFGGLSNQFWSSGMQSLIGELLGGGTPTGLSQQLTSGDNWVWFSSVGGGNVLWPIYLQLMVAGVIGIGDYGTSRPAFLDGIERNDFGWIVLSFQGKVLALRPLGKHVIAYGENGISALVMAPLPGVTSSVHAVTPFGEHSIAAFGILSRHMVGGTNDRHVFIDRSGWLWQLTPDLQLTRLGYREQFSPFLNTDVAIEAGPIEDDIYIGNSSTGYLLAKSGGLTSLNEWPTSVRQIGADLVGFTVGSGYDFSFKTSSFNMGQRQVKLLANVHLDGEGYSNASVRTWWRMSQADAFTAGSWVPINSLGFAFPRASGVDFQLEFKGTGSSNTRLDYANVSWQRSDLRALRGIGQDQTTTGA